MSMLAQLWSSPCTTGCVLRSLVGAFAVTTAVVVASVSFLILTKPKNTFPQKQIEDMVKSCKVKPGKGHDGKLIAIVTGSTAGIGEATVEELYRMGLHVIIASRSIDKCTKVMAEIKSKYPDSKGSLDVGGLDVGDLDSVRNFCTWFKSKYTYLNFLVNNAGIHYMDNGGLFDPNVNTISKQGYDLVFATNYMGHFLLAHLLMPMMSEGRVVNASSTYHFQSDASTLHIGTNGPRAADGKNADFHHKRMAYGVTKLTNVLHAVELQRRIAAEGKQDKIQAVSFCPGWVSTNMVPKRSVGLIIHSLAFKVREGCLAPIGSMFDPRLKGGEFVSNVVAPVICAWYGPAFMKLITLLGVRPTVVDILGFFLVFVEARSYGININRSSDESRDEKIGKELYDWTIKELKAKGYITA